MKTRLNRSLSRRVDQDAFPAPDTADPLTGLPDQRALLAILEREVSYTLRHGAPSAMLLLDLSPVLDRLDPAQRDAALRQLARAVRGGLRDEDIFGRWSGVEFMAILPETDGEEVVLTAERVQAVVSRHSVAIYGIGVAGNGWTCSLGIASCPQDGRDPDTLVALAAQELKIARRLERATLRLARRPHGPLVSPH